MQREQSAPRAPFSLDKIKIKHQMSKSLSKNAGNSASPVIATKATFKEGK
jgi:hypothetical protein